MLTKTAIAGLTALMALGFPPGGRTASPPASPRDALVPISHADLNLATAAGASVMLGRIRAAAGASCEAEPRRDLDRESQFRVCVGVTVDNVVAALANPLVSAMNSGQFTQASLHGPARAGL